MKIARKAGATSQILQIFIADSSSSTGAGLTGLVFNTASLTAYFHRDTDTTATAISLVTMTVGTFTSSGFKEIDATNMPGWYQFCPPNTAFASGASSVGLHLKGATNMAPLPIEVDLDSQVDVTFWNGTVVATPATAGIPDINVKNINNTAAATPGASGGVLISGSNSGTTTLAALTISGATTLTGNVSMAAGLNITQSSSNTSALVVTGNGTGHGAVFTSGAGATGDGVQMNSGATNGNGLTVDGNGTASGINIVAGATGIGLKVAGGATSGVGIDITTTSGDGISARPTAGHALVLTGNGTSKHGAFLTGGAAGTSDGASFVAGTGGVSLRAPTMTSAITGNITGNISGSVGSVTGNLGGNVVGSVASVTARVIANTDQFAGQTITAGAGVTIPSSIASPTNITAGTITTVTNLTNAPTNGDLTATMKTSVTTSATASTPQLSSTGNNNVATAVFTNTMTEAYPTKGSSITLAQALYNMVQMMNEKGIVTTLMTVLKRDQSTPAKTFTLNDATNPTAITETT